MFKTTDLKRKLWLYFGMFATIIVVILWLFQILFLNSFYESMKIAEISRVGKKIVREYKQDNSEFMDIIFQAHFEQGLSVGVYTSMGAPLFAADMVFYPKTPNSFNVFSEIVSRLNRSGSESVSFISSHSSDRYKSAFFGAKLTSDTGENLYLCLNSPLSPMSATTQVLKMQLIIVTIISLLIALILSYFIAKRLARPISNITKSASSLAEGNYDVRFQHGDYAEINQLADVLNHTAKELDKTDSLRRDLLANVSHDLRTPLTIIRSYAEMIRDISGGNPEKRKEHSTVIMEESDRLSLLVTDILDLSKMQSGVVQISPSPFDISNTISKATSSFSVLAEKEGYIFKVDCENPCMVLGDEMRIGQVVYNLISNAVNYTGEDKTVRIWTETTKNTIRINVNDTGKGIPENEQELVWDRYYKSSSTNHRIHIGTGIGLSIVKSILLIHNAKFGIISRQGEGSTFWFELPLVIDGEDLR